MSPVSILVLGAGELGTAILEALASHPQNGPIHVLIRPSTIESSDPAKRSQIASIKSLGVSVIAGDILNATEAELSSLFSPFHTIVSCTGMTYPSGTQLKIARAILAAGVPCYLPWQFGVDYDIIGRDSSQDLFSEQLGVRELLRGQETAKWVIVSTGMFTSFLFEPTFGVVSEDRKTVRALGGLENRVTVTTPKDIGRVVAEILWAAPETEGVVYIAGETLSYGRLGSIVEKTLGTQVTMEEWSVDKLKDDLDKDPENGLKKYRVVFAEGRGLAWDEEQTFNAKKGMKLQGVEEWMGEHMM